MEVKGEDQCSCCGARRDASADKWPYDERPSFHTLIAKSWPGSYHLCGWCAALTTRYFAEVELANNARLVEEIDQLRKELIHAEENIRENLAQQIENQAGSLAAQSDAEPSEVSLKAGAVIKALRNESDNRVLN